MIVTASLWDTFFEQILTVGKPMTVSYILSGVVPGSKIVGARFEPAEGDKPAYVHLEFESPSEAIRHHCVTVKVAGKMTE